jgi:hypothetical protein
MGAMDSDPVALEHFDLMPVPADILGGEEPAVWELRLSGGTVREVLTDGAYVATSEFVFAVPLDVMGNLARRLTELYERHSGRAL